MRFPALTGTREETATQLSVGVLNANFLHLGDDLDTLAEAGVRLLHVDVMDGLFDTQLTVGPRFVKALPDTFLIDVHLMVHRPIDKLAAYVEAGANILTFHVEATAESHRLLQELSDWEVMRGVALNPGTPVSLIEPLLDELEYVLLLAVNPGRSGQSFIPTTAARVAEARQLIATREIAVGVDGGITRSNVHEVVALGVDLIVAGSAVFGAGELYENARSMVKATTSTSWP